LQGKWVKKVTEEAEPGCHICIVGTKLDLVQATTNIELNYSHAHKAHGCDPYLLPKLSAPPQAKMASLAVPQEEVRALAAKHNAHVFEASAKVCALKSGMFLCVYRLRLERI